jgi:hypothetical protein
MEIDLFKLQDKNLDIKPRNWLVVKGSNIKNALFALLQKLERSKISRYKLHKILTKELDISKANAQRLAYLRREWYPLIFIEKLLKLTNESEKDFQKYIEYIKVNTPPSKPIIAVKGLTEELCKVCGAHAADGTLAGSFICITDEDESNLKCFKKWIENTFNIKLSNIRKVKNSNEWKLAFHNKVISRYLNKIFKFPNGKKVYNVDEPEIIKNSDIKFRRAFAIGALSFETGLGVTHTISFCVSSKAFRDSICNILNSCDVKLKIMEKKSSEYWRFWSNTLSINEAKRWLEFFEPYTEKWFKLYEYINGFQGKINKFKDAIMLFDLTFGTKSPSKITLKDVLKEILNLKKTYRYELVENLTKKNELKDYGGKWAHSISHYLHILKRANAIFVGMGDFGPKKSFGTIIREVYEPNPNIFEWKVPFRPWFINKVNYSNLEEIRKSSLMNHIL